MQLQNKHILRFAGLYLACFAIHTAWLAWNHLLLYQAEPVFFINRLDVTGTILGSAGLYKSIVLNSNSRLLLDVVYMMLPVMLLLSVKFNYLTRLVSVLASIIALVYSQVLGSTSYISPEASLSWVFIPILFWNTELKGFYLRLHILRLLFVLFFFSAAVWKVVGGGIFSSETMSGIFFMQHKQLLVDNAGNWYTGFINYLINRPALSYLVYLLGFLSEFIFVVGFFTTRWDRILLWSLVLFIVFDLLFMRIFYFSWLIFAFLFYYSRFKQPAGQA